MSFVTGKPLPRRTVLRGLGATLALPPVEVAMRSAPSSAHSTSARPSPSTSASASARAGCASAVSVPKANVAPGCPSQVVREPGTDTQVWAQTLDRRIEDIFALQSEIARRLAGHAERASGSSMRVARALVLAEPPSVADGEITAKGNLNFHKLLTRRAALLERLYDDAEPALTYALLTAAVTGKDRSRIVEGIIDEVASELPIRLVLNNEPLVTLLCTPTELEELAVGFLLSEGILREKSSIKKLTVDEREAAVLIELSESMLWARVMRGMASMLMAVTPCFARRSASCGFESVPRVPTSTVPSRSIWISSSEGRPTRRTRSA